MVYGPYVDCRHSVSIGLRDTMRTSTSHRQTQLRRRKRQRRGFLAAGIFVVTAISPPSSSPHIATAFVHKQSAAPTYSATCFNPAFATPDHHACFSSRERTWVKSQDRASCSVNVRMAASAAGRERAGSGAPRNKPPSLPQVRMNQGAPVVTVLSGLY